MKKLIAAAFVIVLVSQPASAAGYTYYYTLASPTQETNRWCVPASVQGVLYHKGISPVASQSAIYNQVLNKKRCNPGLDNGLDPLAWAWALYYNTPPGQYYDDFTYTSAYSGTKALINATAVWGEPAGALINKGHHAFNLQGATTSCNFHNSSCRSSTYTISTVYVNDPWYDRDVHSPGRDTFLCPGTGGSYECGFLGLRPQAAITYSTWWHYYYTSWGFQDCAYWNTKLVNVMRTSEAATPDFADDGESNGELKPDALGPTYDSTPGVESPAPREPKPVKAESADIRSLDAAFQIAKGKHGLIDRPEFALSLDGGHIARVVRVEAMSESMPAYLLANVVGKHGLRGVAMFTLADGLPTFAGMTYADQALKQWPAISVGRAREAIHASGLSAVGRPQLVWGWSEESTSPYYPFYRVETDRGTRYVDSFGRVLDQVHLT